MKLITRISLFITIIYLAACGEQGVQGTSYFSSFQGLNSAEALSPTAVKLTWNLDSAYSEYKIYENDSVNPLRSETFSTAQVGNLSPSTDYSYMVSGYSSTAGEKFMGGKFSVRTMDRFTGLPLGGVVVLSGTEIKLSWTLNSEKAKYRIYQKEQGAAWSFATPAGILNGSNEYRATGLTSGKTYCFFVVAEYLDGTSEPAITNTATVDAAAPCQLLTTAIIGLPSVSVSSVIPGGFPWFWTSNGNASFKTEIY
ncbi:MAG: fibronectin type III domain-containing protein, partial [Proteobacteria bacterium]